MPAALAFLPIRFALTYARSTSPFQFSPTIPVKNCPPSPTEVTLPIKATFLSVPWLSILSINPDTQSLPTILPLTLTFSMVVPPLIIFATAATWFAHGIFMSTLPRLIFLIVPPITLPNNGRDKL
ncbi:Uncharacterised protein [Streptococcus pneumoniae]|nr:Uncharacterised protein [Streptococcus pneumoniae]